MKILIAEDDNTTRVRLQRTLEKWGYDVVSATNGAEALEAFKNDYFPMIITDWVMPEMDGLALVKNILAHHAITRKGYVYIIMLTSKSDKKELVEGMEAGADDFVSKPFHPEELRARVRAGEKIIRLEGTLFERNRTLQRINEKMKLDLEAAAEIQNSLLPAISPKTGDVNTAFRFKPCDELAGDILNIFKLDDTQLGFYVLDVSGHGVPAALLAVTLSRILSPVIDDASLLKTRINQPPGYSVISPKHVANQLNKRFQIDSENGQFFTLLYGILNTQTKSLRYVSSGHPGMIYVSSQKREAEILSAPSLPIGFLEENEYEEQEVQLYPGDRLYVYSDGIPEAENPKRDLFGIQRMISVLEENKSLPMEESLDFLLKRVEQWSQSTGLKDDATLLGIEIKGD